jgi:hypothetical protein
LLAELRRLSRPGNSGTENASPKALPPAALSDQTWLRVDEVAQVLRISEAAVGKLVREGARHIFGIAVHSYRN